MPFHPLAPDVTHLKDDELYQKINEISSKMNVAWRLGSNDAVRQMQMILAHYQEEAGNRNRKKLEDMEKNGKDLNKLIDVKK